MNKHEYGVLLDLDGTLVDSLYIYYDAVNTVLHKFGMSCTYEEMFEQSGASGVELYTYFLKKYGKYDPSMKDELYDMYYRVAYKRMKEVSFPNESTQTIYALKDKGYSVAICTGADRKFVDYIIPNELIGVIDSIVTCDDVSFEKPDPETFLSAADCIGISPFNCVVVGDSMKDLLGANSAGMRFILVRSIYNEYIKDGYSMEINNVSELIT